GGHGGRTDAMWIKCARCVTVWLAAAIAAGCGNKNPAAPTVATSMPPAAPANPTGALSISAFSLSGWYDGTFHFVPTVSVAAPSTGRTVNVQRLAFTTEKAGVTSTMGGIAFGSPRRVVLPGATIDLLKGLDPLEMTSPVALASIMATVFFTDDEGQPGSVTAAADVPPVVQGPAAAVLVIKAFTVSAWIDQGRFHYWPKLILTETSGVSR